MSIRRGMIRLAILLGLWGMTAPDAQAVRWRQFTNFTLPATNALTTENWISAKQIVLDGQADDDVFLAGSTQVRLTGILKADCWVVSDQLTSSATCSNSLRALAGNASLPSGTIGRNLELVVRTANLGEKLLVGDSVILLGNEISTRATCYGSMAILASRVILGGDIRGNLRIVSDEITVLPGTRIGGDLSYTAPKALILAPGVQLKGKLVRAPQAFASLQSSAPRGGGAPNWNAFLLAAMFFLGACLTGLIFVRLFPAFAIQCSQSVREHFWRCMLVGLLFFCLGLFVAVAGVLLVFVGWPLAFLSGCVVGILALMGKLAAGIALGSFLLRRKSNCSAAEATSALFPGLFVLYLLSLLPVVGDLALLAATLAGAGGMILAIVALRRGVHLIAPLPPELPERPKNQEPRESH